MKGCIKSKLFLVAAVTLLMLIASPAFSAGNCSPYLGQASINELFKDRTNQANDVDDFVEVKIINSTITFATYSQWSVQLCERDGRGNQNDADGCSAKIGLANFVDTVSPWLVLKDGTIGSFFNFGTGFDAILLDANDDVVDYVSVGGYTLQEQPGCTGAALPFDYQSNSPGASIKFISRGPDGTGDWGGPRSATALPTEGADNDGGATAAALDHFNISPATTNASTCLANAITIIAENGGNNPVPNYTNTIQITVSTNHGNWSINNADGILSPNPHSNDDGAVSYSFVATDNSEIVLDLTNTHAEIVTITVSDNSQGVTSTSVPIAFSRNVFVITEDPIQIAGRPQAMAIEMWTDDPAASPSCGIDSNYNSSAQVLQTSINRFGVLSTALDPSINTVSVPDNPLAAAISLDFSLTPGRATFNLGSTDVGQYELTLADTTLTHSSAIITGTTGLLTVKPFGLAVNNIEAGAAAIANPGSSAPTQPVFIAAGSAFSATVSGVLWNAADDTEGGVGDGVIDVGASFNNNTVAPNFAWDTDLTVVGFTPAGGVVGNLNNSNILSTDFSNGSGTLPNLRYTEVGSFTLQALASNYLGVGSADIVSDEIIVGRFIPAFFQIIQENGMLANSCIPLVGTAFTYIGQTFGYDIIRPGFLVSAMNALPTPTITRNYTGLWAKLNDASVALTAPTSDATQTGSDSTTLMAVTYTPDTNLYNIIDNGNGTLNFEFGDDQFLYDKDGNSEISEFNSDIDLTIAAVVDLDGVSTTAAFTLTPDPVRQRFGRIRMSNVHGSELIDLEMPMIVEYFTGGFYQSNIDDSCTVFDNADITVVADNLSIPGSSTITVTNATAVAGDLGISLTAPGGGITGQIDLRALLNGGVVVNQWLQYDWDGDGLFDNDPTASATFGIFSGNDVNIYIQQIFQ